MTTVPPLSAVITAACLAMAFPINLFPAAGVIANCLIDITPFQFFYK
jgi:hypothetical protein